MKKLLNGGENLMSTIKKFEYFDNDDTTGICVTKNRQSTDSSAHWHSYFEIDFCSSGSGSTVLNGKEYKLKKGTVSFITPSDIHSYKVENEVVFINLNFNFSAIAYSSISELLYKTEGFVFQCNDEEYQTIEGILRKIQEEETKKSAFYEKYLRNLLLNLIIEIYRKNKNNKLIENNAELPIEIRKIIYYINANFKNPITLKEVSDYIGMDYSNIGKYIKKHLNKNFKEYLTDVRMEYARNILLSTDESITDIVFYCGYNSTTYFTNEFRSKFGMSPGQYRKRHK